jgi:hypothetical protein
MALGFTWIIQNLYVIPSAKSLFLPKLTLTGSSDPVPLGEPSCSGPQRTRSRARRAEYRPLCDAGQWGRQHQQGEPGDPKKEHSGGQRQQWWSPEVDFQDGWGRRSGSRVKGKGEEKHFALVVCGTEPLEGFSREETWPDLGL